MHGSWTSTLKISPREVRLLVTEFGAADLLKARLPMSPSHPRALLTLLEGLALWRGRPLVVAIDAGESSPCWYGSGLFGDELWPGESALVRFEFAARARRGARHLKGLGDFRSLRLVPAEPT
jgi:hypothetical protein